MKLQGNIPWKNGKSLSRRQTDGDPFTRLQRQMNGLFDGFFGRLPLDLCPSGAEGFAPRVDVSEMGNEVLVRAEFPGLNEKDIEVTVTGNALSIKEEKKEEPEEKAGGYWHNERSHGHFERNVGLPQGLENDKTKATFKKGVLKVTITKAPGGAKQGQEDRFHPGLRGAAQHGLWASPHGVAQKTNKS